MAGPDTINRHAGEAGRATLSLADVARLTKVERPVVTMWRKREKAGLAFPNPTSDGRFPAAQVLDWIEQTERGNNPDVRRDAAVTVACAHHDDATLDDLLTLLAVRAVTGLMLADADPEDVLDLVDEIDPDDEWLFTEAEAADINGLAADADAIADAAWTTAHAYEALLSALRARRERTAASPNAPQASIELGDELAGFVLAAARALSDRGALVDIGGSAADVLAVRDADADDTDLVLVAAGIRPGESNGSAPIIPSGNAPAAHLTITSAPRQAPLRITRQRYAAHGQRPSIAQFGDDWDLPDGSVILAALPRDPNAAFDVLDEVALQLAGRTMALVVGAASVLTDPLDRELESRRDRFIRADGRALMAAIRLPQGLTRGGVREHLALWLMQADAPAAIRVGDLSGFQPSRAWWQQLLDDIAATTMQARDRAFALLRPASATTILAAGGSLVAQRTATASEPLRSAGDDAVRIHQLLDGLNTPLATGFAQVTPEVHDGRPARHITLAEATRARHISIGSGTRTGVLPRGATRLWTADAVAARTPETVDLLALTAEHPGVQLTRPGDVVFTTVGRPRAIVDAEGGAAVAYPARTLRVAPGTPYSPRAVAASINALATGNSKWRTWSIPVAQDATAADGILDAIDTLDAALRERQAWVDELRTLVVRSVLPGSVTFGDIRSSTKGE